MAAYFGRLGESARDLGFRGVSIDTEYCYRRYCLDHEIYTYDGYSAADLLAGARTQGRAIMSALLDAFPDAVVFELPGYLWSRSIGRALTLGMLEVMAERDAPGGFHLGTERAYCLLDPVSQVAIHPGGRPCGCGALLDSGNARILETALHCCAGRVAPSHGGDGRKELPGAALERGIAGTSPAAASSADAGPPLCLVLTPATRCGSPVRRK